MDSQLPPNAKSDTPPATSAPTSGRAIGNGGGTPGGGTAGAGKVGAARRFPRPPAFIPRFLMLCFRPESWPEAARYPTYVTLIPLVLAIILGAVAIAAGETSRLVHTLETFAADYDARNHYPPLVLSSDGILSAKGDLKSPIRLQLPSMTALGDLTILVDPTGKTPADTYKVPNTVFVTDKEFVFIGSDGPVRRMTIAEALKSSFSEFQLPAAGQTAVIDQKTLTEYVKGHIPYFVFSGVIWAMLQAVAESIWAAVMIFLLAPLVMMAAAGMPLHADGPERRLILPRRAAYRMAAAVMIPLVLVGAALRAVGHPVYDSLGLQGSTLFWFFAAAGLLVWTGYMARQMYLPKDPRRVK